MKDCWNLNSKEDTLEGSYGPDRLGECTASFNVIYLSYYIFL